MTQKDQAVLSNLRHKRNPSSGESQLLIPVAAKVVYSHRTVTVLINEEANSTFSGINSFHTFNEFDGVISFFADIIGNRSISLRGFG